MSEALLVCLRLVRDARTRLAIGLLTLLGLALVHTPWTQALLSSGTAIGDLVRRGDGSVGVLLGLLLGYGVGSLLLVRRVSDPVLRGWAGRRTPSPAEGEWHIDRDRAAFVPAVVEEWVRSSVALEAHRVPPESLSGVLRASYDAQLARTGWQLDPGPWHRAIALRSALAVRIVGERPYLEMLLQGANASLAETVDRVRWESRLRLSLAAPVALVVLGLAVSQTPTWLLVLVLPAGLLCRGVRRQAAADQVLWEALVGGVVSSPTVLEFRNRAELREARQAV